VPDFADDCAAFPAAPIFFFTAASYFPIRFTLFTAARQRQARLDARL
jgi:hypothetical protein